MLVTTPGNLATSPLCPAPWNSLTLVTLDSGDRDEIVPGVTRAAMASSHSALVSVIPGQGVRLTKARWRWLVLPGAGYSSSNQSPE